MFNIGSAQGYLKLNIVGWAMSMRSANASLNSLSRSFSRMGMVATGSLIMIEREFGKFDKAIRHATSVSETTTDQFEKMSQMALDASVMWNKAATSTAQAFYFLGSAGLTVTEQLQAFNTTIMLSRAMGSELSQTVEGTVDVVRAFGLEFADIDRIADQLTKTVISSNQQFRTLSQALTYASSTARLTNNTLAETTAMLGVMANAGIKGSMAGTVLRRAMTNLMAPTGDMAELVYELGLNIYDVSGKMKPFINIMGEISDALKGASDRYKNLVFETLFGRRAIAGQIVLFNYGSDALRKYANEIENAGGTTERVAGKQMKAFSEQLGQLWQQIRRTAIAVGGTLAPAVERLGDAIQTRLKVFEDYIEANKAMIAEALKLTMVLGTVLAVGGPLLIIITSLASNFVALAAVVASPFVALVAALYVFRAVWKQTNDEMKKETAQKAAGWAEGAMGRFAEWGARGLPEHAQEKFRTSFSNFKAYQRGGLGMFGGQTPGLKMRMPSEGGGGVADNLNTAITGAFKLAMKQFEQDTDGMVGNVIEKLKSTHPEIAKLIERSESALKTVMDMYNAFMVKPPLPKLFGLESPYAGPNKAAMENIQKFNKLYGDLVDEMRASLRIPTIWEKRWKSGIVTVINSMESWQRVFTDVNKNMRSEWSNSINDFISEGGKLKDFIENMFKGVLASFNRMMSDILANDLWYSMFGQGEKLPFGTASIFHRGSIAKGGDYTTIPDFFEPSTPAWSPEFPPKVGQFSAAQKMAPVIINVENKGTPVNMSASKPAFNGKEYVVNVVMEEYNTNPNFRNVLNG